MTGKNAKAMSIDHFTTLLDAYGARLERWPPAHRLAAGQLLVADANARAAMAEARALETLLDRAAGPSRATPDDLVDRIVATAVKPRIVTSTSAPPTSSPAHDVVVAIAPGRMTSATALGGRNTGTFGVRRLPAAAALAASLVLGLAIGSLDLVHAPMRGLIELASSDGHESGVGRLVSSLQSDGLSTALDEDTQ